MKSRHKALSILLLMVMMVLFTGTLLYAGSIPPMINYSGSLTDTGGTPVANGNYNIEFKIYDVASGGASLWSEKWDTTTSQITVVGGIFNVMLGFHSPIPAAFFADHPVTYLGIKVGTDSEMLPRQQITSVGYAFTAGNGVPKGGIIMWSGTTDGNGNPIINGIPDTSWHICDGSNGTPDLRSRFVVGVGTGVGLSTYAMNATGGEEQHTLTISEMPSHTHTQNAHNHGITDPGHNHTVPLKQDDQDGSGSNGTTAGSSNSGTNTTGISINNATATNQNTGGVSGITQAHENRPPYYALAFIMKL